MGLINSTLFFFLVLSYCRPNTFNASRSENGVFLKGFWNWIISEQ